jgi:acetyltransferase-like isoleucine patch superfamily enzyme
MGRLPQGLVDLILAAGYGHGPKVASALRKRWAKLRNPTARLEFGPGVYAGPGFSIHAPAGGAFTVGAGVEFRRNFRLELGAPEARVSVGAGCYFTYDVIIACSTSIDIGDRVGLGQCTFVVDGSHRFRDLTKPFAEQGYDYRRLTIENDAQVHSKVTIVESIGERAVIGANAVVSRPIPPFTVAAGVPARVVDYFGPPELAPPEWEGR